MSQLNSHQTPLLLQGDPERKEGKIPFMSPQNPFWVLSLPTFLTLFFYVFVKEMGFPPSFGWWSWWFWRRRRSRQAGEGKMVADELAANVKAFQGWIFPVMKLLVKEIGFYLFIRETCVCLKSPIFRVLSFQVSLLFGL